MEQEKYYAQIASEKKRRFGSIAIALLLFLVLVTCLVTRPIKGDCLAAGDASARYLIALHLADQPRLLLSLKPWLSVWPPVPFATSAFLLFVLTHVPMIKNLGYPVLYQLGSCIAMTIGLLMICLAGARGRYDRLPYYLLCAFTVPPLIAISDQGYSECYTILFIGLAILAAFSSLNHGATWPLALLCSAATIAACGCRTESIVVVLPCALLFLLTAGAGQSLVVLLPPTLAVIAKFALADYLFPPAARFFNAGHHFGYAPYVLSNTLSYVRVLGGGAKVYLVSSIACLSAILISRKLRVAGESDSVKIAPIPRIATHARVIELYSIYGFWLLSFCVYTAVFVWQLLKGSFDVQARYTSIPLLWIGIFAASCFSELIAHISKSCRRSASFSVVLYLLPALVIGLWAGALVPRSYQEYSRRTVLSGDEEHVVRVLRSMRTTRQQPVIFDFADWHEFQIAAQLAAPGDFALSPQSGNYQQDFAGEFPSPFLFTAGLDQPAVTGQLRMLHLLNEEFFAVESPGRFPANGQDYSANQCFQCLESLIRSNNCTGDNCDQITTVDANASFVIFHVRKK